MPMELYSSEAFIRDIVNAISSSEGKPLYIGGNCHQGIDRDYAFQLISEAKKAIEGNVGSSATSPASKAVSSRTAAIKKFMTKGKSQDVATKPSRARKVAKTAPRKIAYRKPRVTA